MGIQPGRGHRGLCVDAAARRQTQPPPTVGPIGGGLLRFVSGPLCGDSAAWVENQGLPAIASGLVLQGLPKKHVSGPVRLPLPSWPQRLSPQQ
jgi:hypothetical protein